MTLETTVDYMYPHLPFNLRVCLPRCLFGALTMPRGKRPAIVSVTGPWPRVWCLEYHPIDTHPIFPQIPSTIYHLLSTKRTPIQTLLFFFLLTLYSPTSATLLLPWVIPKILVMMLVERRIIRRRLLTGHIYRTLMGL